MGIKTKIEWCDSTINPIMGCTGCALRKSHCYAATLYERYAGRKGWPQSFDYPEHFPGRLEKAIKWRDLTGTKRPDKPWLDGYPRMIFVNDLSDGFCPDVDPEQWLSPLLDRMTASPHIWLLLTKWPDRMADFFGQCKVPDNLWPGTSITTQKDADERIPWLLRIDAGVRVASCEPLLESLQLSWAFEGWHSDPRPAALDPGIDWVIAGGETGHVARPMKPQWARSIRDQCQDAGVPYFFKAWGQFVPEGHWRQLTMKQRNKKGAVYSFNDGPFPLNQRMYRVDKKVAGRLLDGQEYNEMPRRQL